VPPPDIVSGQRGGQLLGREHPVAASPWLGRPSIQAWKAWSRSPGKTTWRMELRVFDVSNWPLKRSS
jgi:hypothetical protein